MDYLARLHQLRLQLSQIPCDALLIESPIHLLYLTGLDLSTGKLLITEADALLVVDGRYFELGTKLSPCPVCRLEGFVFKEWLRQNLIHRLAFESDKTTYQAFLNLQTMANELQQNHFSVTLVPIESPVQPLRMIKDLDELHLLRQAAKLGYEGYEFIISQLREGITEQELALELEIFWKRKGAKRLAFDSIIAFGANSSMPHYRAGLTPLEWNMPILIDIGVVWKHYHSDMTRVVFFGEPSHQIKEIYEIVAEAKKRALALCRPGTKIGDLDRAARDYITSHGYGETFTHSLGHGLGLEIHEPPTIRSKGLYADYALQPNMVITIEPGIYLPGVGGVRLEDTILITESGYENLTNQGQGKEKIN